MRILSYLLWLSRAAFWLCLLFALDAPYLAVFTLLSLVWHELFHVIAFWHLKKHARMQTRLYGLRLFPVGTLSYKEERRIAAAGPIGGGIGAILAFSLMPLAPEFFLDFALCHLFTSLSNLLPIEGYDGYRILESTLAIHSLKCTDALARGISFVFSALLALLALFIFGILGAGLWASGAFLFALLSAIPEEKGIF